MVRPTLALRATIGVSRKGRRPQTTLYRYLVLLRLQSGAITDGRLDQTAKPTPGCLVEPESHYGRAAGQGHHSGDQRVQEIRVVVQKVG